MSCFIDDDWTDKLESMGEDEEAMLDQTFHVQKNSRLSCQVEYNASLNGIKMSLAKE